MIENLRRKRIDHENVADILKRDSKTIESLNNDFKVIKNFSGVRAKNLKELLGLKAEQERAYEILLKGGNIPEDVKEALIRITKEVSPNPELLELLKD